MGLKIGNTKLLITIVIVVAGVATSWGVMKATVDSVDTLAQENKAEIKEKVDQEDFNEVKEDVKEMIVKVAKIEVMQDQMDKKIDKILEKVLGED